MPSLADEKDEIWLIAIPVILIILLAGGKYLNNRFIVPFIRERIKPFIRKFWNRLHFHPPARHETV